jgi:hypothetical protein
MMADANEPGVNRFGQVYKDFIDNDGDGVPSATNPLL